MVINSLMLEFRIVHVPGKYNERADALSRRDQDMPNNLDERFLDRRVCLLKPQVLVSTKNIQSLPIDLDCIHNCEISIIGSDMVGLDIWDSAISEDSQYARAIEIVKQGVDRSPTDLHLKVSISECSESKSGALLFRGRRWVPNGRNLETRLIQSIHDSPLYGHPGREITYALIARIFFWPGMASDVRRFVEKCDGCGRNKAWRSRRQGFLKPLPIPDRIWSEISMDFITDLSNSEGCTNMIVITDRLSKGVIADRLKKIEAEGVAKWFIKNYLPHHFLPKAIVSDRGSQFTSAFWKRICDQLRIQLRLSRAFSPETDRATERMNEAIETLLQKYVDWNESNSMGWLPVLVSSIGGRDSASTGTNSFFMAHGWNKKLIKINEDDTSENTH